MSADRTEGWEAAGSESEVDAGRINRPALAELLDHIAEELALEYVRLMETAADEERSRSSENEDKED